MLQEIGLSQEVANKQNVLLEISSVLTKIFEDGKGRYGPRKWSPNIIKRLEKACGIDNVAPGFPSEMVDNELEAQGYEIVKKYL